MYSTVEPKAGTTLHAVLQKLRERPTSSADLYALVPNTTRNYISIALLKLKKRGLVSAPRKRGGLWRATVQDPSANGKANGSANGNGAKIMLRVGEHRVIALSLAEASEIWQQLEPFSTSFKQVH